MPGGVNATACQRNGAVEVAQSLAVPEGGLHLVLEEEARVEVGGVAARVLGLGVAVVDVVRQLVQLLLVGEGLGRAGGRGSGDRGGWQWEMGAGLGIGGGWPDPLLEVPVPTLQVYGGCGEGLRNLSLRLTMAEGSLLLLPCTIRTHPSIRDGVVCKKIAFICALSTKSVHTGHVPCFEPGGGGHGWKLIYFDQIRNHMKCSKIRNLTAS